MGQQRKGRGGAQDSKGESSEKQHDPLFSVLRHLYWEISLAHALGSRGVTITYARPGRLKNRSARTGWLLTQPFISNPQTKSHYLEDYLDFTEEELTHLLTTLVLEGYVGVTQSFHKGDFYSRKNGPTYITEITPKGEKTLDKWDPSARPHIAAILPRHVEAYQAFDSIPRWQRFVYNHDRLFEGLGYSVELLGPMQQRYVAPRSEPKVAMHVDADAEASEAINNTAHGSDAGSESAESQRPWWRRWFGS